MKHTNDLYYCESADVYAAGAAVAAADPTPVSVSGGTIHFEGKLVNAACAVSTPNSPIKTVTLGQYRTASLRRLMIRDRAGAFSIVLNDCDPESGGYRCRGFLCQR